MMQSVMVTGRHMLTMRSPLSPATPPISGPGTTAQPCTALHARQTPSLHGLVLLSSDEASVTDIGSYTVVMRRYVRHRRMPLMHGRNRPAKNRAALGRASDGCLIRSRMISVDITLAPTNAMQLRIRELRTTQSVVDVAARNLTKLARTTITSATNRKMMFTNQAKTATPPSAASGLKPSFLVPFVCLMRIRLPTKTAIWRAILPEAGYHLLGRTP